MTLQKIKDDNPNAALRIHGVPDELHVLGTDGQVWKFTRKGTANGDKTEYTATKDNSAAGLAAASGVSEGQAAADQALGATDPSALGGGAYGAAAAGASTSADGYIPPGDPRRISGLMPKPEVPGTGGPVVGGAAKFGWMSLDEARAALPNLQGNIRVYIKDPDAQPTAPGGAGTGGLNQLVAGTEPDEAAFAELASNGLSDNDLEEFKAFLAARQYDKTRALKDLEKGVNWDGVLKTERTKDAIAKTWMNKYLGGTEDYAKIAKNFSQLDNESVPRHIIEGAAGPGTKLTYPTLPDDTGWTKLEYPTLPD
jgi:hypothetical protein